MTAWGLRSNQKNVTGIDSSKCQSPQLDPSRNDLFQLGYPNSIQLPRNELLRNYLLADKLLRNELPRNKLSSIQLPRIIHFSIWRSLIFLPSCFTLYVDVVERYKKLEIPISALCPALPDDINVCEEYSFLQQNAIYLSLTRHFLNDPNPSMESLMLTFFSDVDFGNWKSP